MANGSHKQGPATADRLREKYAKHNRMTQKALDAARVPVSTPPGSEPYREEMDSVTETEATIGKSGISLALRKAPPWLSVVIYLGLGALALAAFVAWLWLRR